jgi:hypothetical protein
MVVKSAHDGEGVGAHSHPSFTVFTITYKTVVHGPAERADVLLLFLLYPYMYSVGRNERK